MAQIYILFFEKNIYYSFFFLLNHDVFWGALIVEGIFKSVPQFKLEVPAQTERHMFSQQIRLFYDSNLKINPVKLLKRTLLPIKPTLYW